MKDFKTPPGSRGRKPPLKSRLKSRKGKRTTLPKGFQPLPVPKAAQRSRRESVGEAAPRQGASKLAAVLANAPLLKTLIRKDGPVRPARLIVGGAVLWMCLGAVMGGAALWEASLQTVTLSGATALSVEDVVAMTGLTPEMKLSAIDPFELGRRVATHPMVAKADVRRIFPGELIVTVRQRRPRYRARDDQGVEVLLDETLMVLDRHTTTIVGESTGNRAKMLGEQPLPLVTGIGSTGRMNLVLEDDALNRGLALLRIMEAMGFEEYDRMVVEAGHPFLLRVRLPGGRQLVVPEDRLGPALEAYNRLRTHAPTLISSPKVIDLSSLHSDGGGRVFLRNR